MESIFVGNGMKQLEDYLCKRITEPFTYLIAADINTLLPRPTLFHVTVFFPQRSEHMKTLCTLSYLDRSIDTIVKQIVLDYAAMIDSENIPQVDQPQEIDQPPIS